jgi:hypothetical protein
MMVPLDNAFALDFRTNDAISPFPEILMKHLGPHDECRPDLQIKILVHHHAWLKT